VDTPYDSTGPVSAGKVQPHPDPAVSDEIFTIFLGLEQIRQAFAYSPEAYSLLEGIYQAVLGRPMDATGKQGYANALANGWTLSQVRNDIAHSLEAYGHLESIYQAVLGRAHRPSLPRTLYLSLRDAWLDACRHRPG
jgi:hypothetical protein